MTELTKFLVYCIIDIKHLVCCMIDQQWHQPKFRNGWTFALKRWQARLIGIVMSWSLMNQNLAFTLIRPDSESNGDRS
jgi:hypothetical protein